MKLPRRAAPLLFALILSGTMSLIVSGIATVRAVGLVDGFAGLWMASWLPSWAVAFPAVFLLAPLVRRLVAFLTEP